MRCKLQLRPCRLHISDRSQNSCLGLFCDSCGHDVRLERWVFLLLNSCDRLDLMVHRDHYALVNLELVTLDLRHSPGSQSDCMSLV